uniref:Uncharacterized protein n=1 Tax=Chromera velia CCMP2878 TaxID=1169474 RepID=A0A0G4FKG9_9ALVE|eukprot:Cvel_17430.t1-p1 / transcript=Cvel_17430.t1 / gene=Cvel_17430 / organism=Chromera_velia_CCMP2878 / gene_product=hypothetical protein / transcript_product=hypothetical protein / location=Cvel_scaffold1389:35350-36496(+) / protein_length=101 / sequence_SO=supercontig / SO=protein_coding / is_pseudo=false
MTDLEFRQDEDEENEESREVEVVNKRCIAASTMENYMLRLGDFGSTVAGFPSAHNGNLPSSNTATGKGGINPYAPPGSVADSFALKRLCEWYLKLDNCPQS